jgi:hypothetical protein
MSVEKKALAQACAVSSPVSWGFERSGDITTVDKSRIPQILGRTFAA